MLCTRLSSYTSESLSKVENHVKETQRTLLETASRNQAALEDSLSKIKDQERGYHESLLAGVIEQKNALNDAKKVASKTHRSTESHLNELTSLCVGLKLSNEHLVHSSQRRSFQFGTQLKSMLKLQRQSVSWQSGHFQALDFNLRGIRYIGESIFRRYDLQKFYFGIS